MLNNKIAKSISVILVILATIVTGYLLYISFQYYRIDDYYLLTSAINNNQNDTLRVENDYKILTYNLGFGAYDKEFSFFLDKGKMANGKKVVGKNSKAKNKETVIKNISGALDTVLKYQVDFMLFQEVDTDGTRSRHVNQYKIIQEKFSNMASVFGVNFHSAYLAYPIFDHHGKNISGLVTTSNFKIHSAVRRQLPVDKSFINKFFDLDRCLVLTRHQVAGDRELVVINVHLSAYDEGGLIRSQQMEVLNTILEQEYKKGNYVIAGGDFNHDIANSADRFPSNQQKPQWPYPLTNDDLVEHFSFIASNNIGTCRSGELPYEKGVNYEVTIDGYIISDNITLNFVENIDTGYQYSDHNPVLMSFKLNRILIGG